MSERRTRGQGNNPGVTKPKIIEILLKQSDWTPEPDIRDEIASELAIKEPKSLENPAGCCTRRRTPPQRKP